MSTFRYPECAACCFHDVEPVMCENCNNLSEFLDKTYNVEPVNYRDFYEDRGIE